VTTVRRTGIASIHDVEPDTLERVAGLMSLLDRHEVHPRTLLVVPGLGWMPTEVDRLRAWAEAGATLAGHGWIHRAPPPAGLHHRLHAALLSRDQAEHLSRSREDLLGRVRDCHAWFAERDLPEPELYVPPAWALGALQTSDLPRLPFRWYETLTGLVEAATGRLRRLPLVGFEADTAARRRALRLTNGLALAWGRASGRPVRISLHPDDLQLLLAEEVEGILARPWRWVGEAEAAATDPPPAVTRSAGPPSDPPG